MLENPRIGINKRFAVIILTSLLLIALTGCQASKKQAPSVCLDKKPVTPAPVKKSTPPASLLVKSVVLTKDKVPMGGSGITVKNNRVNPDELFGPPNDEAWPKKGYVFLIASVDIESDSDDKWVNIVRSSHLVDSKGSKHRLGLWYYRDAYRPTIAFTFGRNAIRRVPSTKLLFHLPDPLPVGLKMMTGGKEVANISSLLP